MSLDQGQCFYSIRIKDGAATNSELYVNNLLVEPDGAATIIHVTGAEHDLLTVRSSACMSAMHDDSVVRSDSASSGCGTGLRPGRRVPALLCFPIRRSCAGGVRGDAVPRPVPLGGGQATSETVARARSPLVRNAQWSSP